MINPTVEEGEGRQKRSYAVKLETRIKTEGKEEETTNTKKKKVNREGN